MNTTQQLNQAIGFRLRSIRESQAPKLTQEMVAHFTGIKRQAMSAIERGKQAATVPQLVLLAQLYGIEPWMILHDDWCNLTGCEDRE